MTLTYTDRKVGLDGQELSSSSEPPVQIDAVKWSTRLDGGCPACVAKHLGQAILLAGDHLDGMRPTTPENLLLNRAIILLQEARAGYAGHVPLARACVTEAEQSIAGNSWEDLRTARLEKRPEVFSFKLHRWIVEHHVPTSGATRAWAHVAEAFAELPRGDYDNRAALRALEMKPWPDIDDVFVPEVSRILKNVGELYELP